MRVPILFSSAILLVGGLSPALAQLSGGVGSSNSANQSFQNQNQMRGLQQQQTFDTNQNRLNSSTNQMNAAPRATGTGIVRRGGRPERER